MARSWIEHPKGIFETPFGAMDFAITQGNHVSISAGSNYDKSPKIVVNRKPYYVHLHLFLQPDGSWAREDEFREPNMSPDPSRVTQEKAYLGIKGAWESFIQGDEIGLLEGERSHLNNRIMSVDEEIAKAEAALKELDSKRDALLARERAVQDRRKELMKQGGFPAPRDWSPRGEVPEHGEEEES